VSQEETQWTVSDHLDECGEVIFERGGKVLIERLYELAHKGYKPDFDMDFTESIWLRHSARKDRWPYDTLILYPSGCVVSLQTREALRIDPWETDKFEKFLKMIPMPTLGDKTRVFRASVSAWILIAIFVGAFSFGAEWVASVLGFHAR
jgi:hypothetical protein